MKILITSILTIFISINLVSFNEDIKEIDLPELGDRVSGAVSSDEEKAIGEMFLQQVYSNAPLISDPIIFEYTEHLIYRLSEYRNNPPLTPIIPPGAANAFKESSSINNILKYLSLTWLYSESL